MVNFENSGDTGQVPAQCEISYTAGYLLLGEPVRNYQNFTVILMKPQGNSSENLLTVILTVIEYEVMIFELLMRFIRIFVEIFL